MKNTEVVNEVVAIPCPALYFSGCILNTIDSNSGGLRFFRYIFLVSFWGGLFCFFNLRLNSSFILEKNKAICKEKKKTLFQCLSVFFYHSTPTVATWGAQIRVGHQLIMPVSEPCKRLLMCWAGEHICIYIYENSQLLQKKDKWKWLPIPSMVQSELRGDCREQGVTTGRSSHSD